MSDSGSRQDTESSADQEQSADLTGLTEVEPADAEVASALEKLGKEHPGKITEIMTMMGIGPVSNPLHRKMNENHITQILELASSHDEREYNLHKSAQENESRQDTSNRRYMFAGFALVVGLILVVLYLFQDKPDTLIPALSGIGGLVGGFLGGWGFGKVSRD